MSTASLKTMAESKEGGVSKSVIFRVDPNKIEFEPGFNLREEGKELDAHIERLFNSMKAGAFIPPVDVSVVEGRIIARDGHCRTRAAQKLREEMSEFTLEVRQFRGNDADSIIHMLGTGSGGKPLSPLEQGKGFLRLIRLGLTATEIAGKLGVSRPTIDNGITLAEAPTELQRMIVNGETSATTVRDAIKAGPEAVKALKDAVKDARTAPEPSAAAPKGKAAKKATKKKKVTAKNLKGTAADKSKKKTKRKADAAPEVEPTAAVPAEPEAAPRSLPPLPDNQIMVILDRDNAAAAEKFLRDFMGEEAPDLKAVADALQTALL